MKVRWKHGKNTTVPTKLHEMHADCEELLPLNFWQEVMGWGHVGNGEGQESHGAEGE